MRGQRGQQRLQVRTALFALGGIFHAFLAGKALAEMLDVLDRQHRPASPCGLLTRQVQRDGEQVGLRVGDLPALPVVRAQQAQVGFLHQVFGLLARTTPREEAPQHRRVLNEHARQAPSCVFGHGLAPPLEVRRKVGAEDDRVVTTAGASRLARRRKALDSRPPTEHHQLTN